MDDQVSGERIKSGSAPLRRMTLILEILALESDGLSLGEIALRAQLPLASVHRLLGNMIDAGLVWTNERRSIYRLGPRLLRIAHLSTSPERLSEICEPVLQPAANHFGLTAYLVRLAGKDIELCCAFLPEGVVAVHPGHAFPPNATAVGRILFSHQGEPLLDEIVKGPHERFRPKTPIDPAEVRKRLYEARERGFATSDDELDANTFAVAVPVCVGQGDLLYSLGIVGLRETFDSMPPAEEVALSLSEVARNLSTRLVGTGSQRPHVGNS